MNRRLLLESLEQRQLLTAAPELFAVRPNDGSLFAWDSGNSLDVAPRELRLLFKGGADLDRVTLDGIRITRSGADREFDVASTSSDLGTEGAVVVEFLAVKLGLQQNGLEVLVTESDHGDASGPTVTVTGTLVTVDLNRNPARPSTAGDLLAAINDDPLASRLLTARLVSGDPATDLTGTVLGAATASARFGDGNYEVRFSARQSGSAGNGLLVMLTKSSRPDGLGPLVTLIPGGIAVDLNTHPGLETTVEQLLDAVNSHPGASQLVVAELVPAHLVTPDPLATVVLSGGVDQQPASAVADFGLDRDLVITANTATYPGAGGNGIRLQVESVPGPGAPTVARVDARTLRVTLHSGTATTAEMLKNAINNAAVGLNASLLVAQPSGPGTMADVVALADGGGRSEIQKLTFGGTITGGSFRLNYGGNLTTGTISWSSNPTNLATNIRTALNGIFGAGNTAVEVMTPTEYRILFTGSLANANLEQLQPASIALSGTAPTVASSTLMQGAGNEVQKVTISHPGGAGSVRMSYAGTAASAPLVAPYTGLTATAVQNHLNSIPNLNGAPMVLGAAGGPFTVILRNNLAGIDLLPIGTTTTGATSATVATVANGGSVDEMQQLTFDAGVSGGTFRLEWDAYGLSTGDIAWHADPSVLAGDIQTALDLLLGAGNTSVSPVSGIAYSIAFQAEVGGTNHPPLTPVPSLAGGTVAVSTLRDGAGREVQRLTLEGTEDSVTLAYDGAPAAAPLAAPYDSLTADQVRANLDTIPALRGQVVVLGEDGGPFTLIYRMGTASPVRAEFVSDVVLQGGGNGYPASAFTDFGTSLRMVLTAATPGADGNGIRVQVTKGDLNSSGIPDVTENVGAKTIQVVLNNRPGSATTVEQLRAALDATSLLSVPEDAVVPPAEVSLADAPVGTYVLGGGSGAAAPLRLSGAKTAQATSGFNAANPLAIRLLAAATGEAGNGIRVAVTAADRGTALPNRLPLVSVSGGNTIQVVMNNNAANPTTARELLEAINTHAQAQTLLQARLMYGSQDEPLGNRPVDYSPLVLGGVDDVVIEPGYRDLLSDNPNVVVYRFAETLPDDHYRIEVFGFDEPADEIRALRNVRNVALQPRVAGDDRDTMDFRLNLGAQIISVVPQPVGGHVFQLTAVGDFRLTFDGHATAVPIPASATADQVRDALLSVPGLLAGDVAVTPLAGGSWQVAFHGRYHGRDLPAFGGDANVTVASAGRLNQALDQIVVYFNDDDLHLTPVTTGELGTDPSAVNPDFYQLILTRDTVTNRDDIVFRPQSITYDPQTDIAVLTFPAPLHELRDPETGATVGAATFRLRIGTNETLPLSPRVLDLLNPTNIDAHSSFAAAFDLSGFFDVGPVIEVTHPGAARLHGKTFTIEDNEGNVRRFEFNDPSLGVPSSGNQVVAFESGDTGVASSPDAIAGAIAAAVNLVTGWGVSATAVDNRVQLTGEREVTPEPALFGVQVGTQALVIRQEIRNTTSTDPRYRLDSPGAEDEPGHREIPAEDHLLFGKDSVDVTPGITTRTYSFDASVPYGFDSLGQPLYNEISESQKQRAREVFEFYGNLMGIQFVEREQAGLFSTWVITGDLAGIGGVSSAGGERARTDWVGATLRPMVVMDIAENWEDNFGHPGGLQQDQLVQRSPCTRSAMSLGLGHSYGVAARHLDGRILLEYFPRWREQRLAVRPNGGARVSGRHRSWCMPQMLFRKREQRHRPVPLRNPCAGVTGLFQAETLAERLPGSSLLDTQLNLYRQWPDGRRELISQNDDYFSEDSYLEIDAGRRACTTSASAPAATRQVQSVDPRLGLRRGVRGERYELKLNFRPAPRSQHCRRDRDRL
jgi:hypothetical protein